MSDSGRSGESQAGSTGRSGPPARLLADTEALLNRAEAGQSIDPDELKSLLHLGRLVALRDSLHRPSSSHRWYFVAVLCVTLVVIAYLGLTPQSHILAHLVINTDAVEFKLSANASLNDRLSLSQITAADLSEVIDEDVGSIPASVLRLSCADTGDDKGIWTESIALGVGSSVEISKTIGKNRARVILDQLSGINLALTYRGRVVIAQDARERVETVDIPKVIILRSKAALDLVLSPTDATACIVCSPVPIATVKFVGSSLSHLGEDLFDTRYSPVRKAEIRFDDFLEKTIEIGARESLRLEILDGMLRRISTASTGELAMEIDGNIERLETGSLDRPRDLRPSRLKWLVTRETSSAVWAGIVYLCGLLLAVARWWGAKV